MLNYVKASGQIWTPESGQGNTPKVTQPRGWSPMTWLLRIYVVVIVAVICIAGDGISGPAHAKQGLHTEQPRGSSRIWMFLGLS